MSALPASALAAIKSGLRALNVQALTYQIRTVGTWPTAVAFSAVVTGDSDGQALADAVREDARTIVVRPVDAIPVNIGDRIIYGGITYLIDAIDGADVQRITASYRAMNGVQSTDRPRFQGT
jgi:hypothetical protein